MSCRVLGRRVEEAILQYLVQQARAAGITEMIGRYIPTAKNGLVRDHFSRLGFAQIARRGRRNDVAAGGRRLQRKGPADEGRCRIIAGIGFGGVRPRAPRYAKIIMAIRA